MLKLKRSNYILITVCVLITLVSFILSFVFIEDSLGSAYRDYKFHEEFFFKFADDFSRTFSEYGSANKARNSPIFFIIVSQLLNLGFDVEYLKYLNIIFVIGIMFFFLRSLELIYQNIRIDTKILFLCTLILSPTIRSLTIHPYPLLWAINFFIISIYFYLKFLKSKNNKMKFKNAFFSILNLSIASYFTPNFAVFILFYFIKFLSEFKITTKILFLCLFTFLFSLPALIFLVWKDFYLFQNSGYDVTYFEKLNPANKLVIISSIIFLFIIPAVKFVKISRKSFDLFNLEFLLIMAVFFLSIYFFDFKNGAGGGIFFQLSNLIFTNNYFLFSIFFITIFIFYLLKIYNFDNILIFFILIIYNLQYTIYYKYFDPILLFVILFFMKFNKNIFEINVLGKRYFIFYLMFLIVNLCKGHLKIILT